MSRRRHGLQVDAIRAAAVMVTLLMLGGLGTQAEKSQEAIPDLAQTRTLAAPMDPVPLASPAAAESFSPAPMVMPASRPVSVAIPAIGVDSSLMKLGLLHDGTLEVPSTASPAGWFTGAPTPGELGPAIFAGHVTLNGHKGVFYRLHELAPGDEIFVARADGTVAVFAVTHVEQYPKKAFPTAVVYGNIDFAGLRLVTCGGELDSGGFVHKDNIVVFAKLVRTE